MPLLDRYLDAVRFWLPRGQKDDILAELSDDLHGAIESRQSALGHPLTDSDLAALLKERGHPMVVANGYVPQRSLIGPRLFPLYAFTLKIVALAGLTPWTLVWAIVLLEVPGAAPAGAGVSSKLMTVWSVFWLGASTLFGIITLIFALVERFEPDAGLMKRWDPRRLPATIAEIPRFKSATNLALLVMFGLWWSVYLSSRQISLGSLHVTLTPRWAIFYYSNLALIAIGVVLAAVNLARPHWTRARALTQLAVDALNCTLAGWMLKAQLLAAIEVTGVPTERTAAVTAAINLWAGRAMPLAVLVGAAVVIWDVYRLNRLRDRPLPISHTQAAAT